MELIRAAYRYHPSKGKFARWSWMFMSKRLHRLRSLNNGREFSLTDGVIRELPQMESGMSVIDARDFIEACLSMMTPVEASYVTSHYIDEKTYPEMTMEVGVKANTIKSIATKALKRTGDVLASDCV